MAKTSLVQNDPKAKAAAVKEIKGQIKVITDNIKAHTLVLATAAKAHTASVKELLVGLGKSNIDASKLEGKEVVVAVQAANKAYTEGVKAANAVYTEATGESIKAKAAAAKLLERANAALVDAEKV